MSRPVPGKTGEIRWHVVGPSQAASLAGSGSGHEWRKPTSTGCCSQIWPRNSGWNLCKAKWEKWRSTLKHKPKRTLITCRGSSMLVIFAHPNSLSSCLAIHWPRPHEWVLLAAKAHVPGMFGSPCPQCHKLANMVPHSTDHCKSCFQCFYNWFQPLDVQTHPNWIW